jgi:hypothetical protein
MNTKQYSNSSVIGGILLIALGLVFFAVTQGFLNLSWGNIWPAFLVIVGVVALAQGFATDDPKRRTGQVFGGTLLTLLGGFFFATTLDLISWGDQGSLWPIYPLIVGVSFFAAYFASGREQNGYLIPAAILTLVGVVFLAFILTGTSYALIGKLWPLFLIIGGVLMLVAPRARQANM